MDYKGASVIDVIEDEAGRDLFDNVNPSPLWDRLWSVSFSTSCGLNSCGPPTTKEWKHIIAGVEWKHIIAGV